MRQAVIQPVITMSINLKQNDLKDQGLDWKKKHTHTRVNSSSVTLIVELVTHC